MASQGDDAAGDARRGWSSKKEQPGSAFRRRLRITVLCVAFLPPALLFLGEITFFDALAEQWGVETERRYFRERRRHGNTRWFFSEEAQQAHPIGTWILGPLRSVGPGYWLLYSVLIALAVWIVATLIHRWLGRASK